MEAEVKEETLPPGFRFHPTDEELITCYLINKILDSNFTGRAIADVNLHKCEPWDLPGKAKMGEKEWYFFSLRDRKYPTGVRTNRATSSGYWKTTGKDKEIFNSVSSELLGLKKTLVFYRGRAPTGEKTNWVMHEYRIHSKSAFRTSNSKQNEWVVCRVFQKSAARKKYSSNHCGAIKPQPLEISPSAMPSQLVLQTDSFQFPLARNHTEGAEQAELSQLNHQHTGVGVGGFPISGLNLNLAGAITSTQQIFQPPPLPASNQQEVASSILTCFGIASEAGYGADMMRNANVISNRFMAMDHFPGLDNYWPSY